MTHAVIFDMDGLMFDTERLFVQAWDYAGEKAGLGKTGYMVMKTLGANRETGRAIWRREFGERYRQEEIEGYTQEFFDQYYRPHPLPVKKGAAQSAALFKRAPVSDGYRLLHAAR